MSGTDDLNNLFSRVTALEKEDLNNEQTVSQIVKVYPTLGLTVKITYFTHQYRICGDTQPLYPAVCAADSFI